MDVIDVGRGNSVFPLVGNIVDWALCRSSFPVGSKRNATRCLALFQ